MFSNMDFNAWRVSHREGFTLKSYATSPPKDRNWEEDIQSDHALKMGVKLGQLQGLLHASKSNSLLLVLQGMDTSGKDGTIRRVFSHVSPLGVRAEAFSAPSAQELSHDFLWRVHQRTPALGEIAVFNRSHYEDVLVTRVKGLIDKAQCARRFEHIQAFEKLLSDQGMKIVKCFLNISKEEQKRRLQERMQDPHKQWKLQPSDFEDRKLWDQFQHAYQEAIRETSTHEAPWYIIPADSKHFRDLAITQLLIHALEQMQLEAPKPSFDLSNYSLSD